MPQAAEDVLMSTTEHELIPGAWYAAAADTSPLPAYVATGPIKELLGADEHKFGTVQVFTDKADLPADVGSAIRNAKNANVWATGQFTPPGWDGTDRTPRTVQIDSHVIAIEKLRRDETRPTPTGSGTEATKGGEMTTTKPSDGPSTQAIVIVGVAIVAVSAAGIGLLWWATKRKKKRNGRRRKRKSS